MYKAMQDGQVKSVLHGEPLFKVLSQQDRAAHGGDFDYAAYLPTKNADGSWAPGKWTPEVSNPDICRRGYHLTTKPFTAWHIDGGNVYEAAGRGAYSAYGRDTLRIEGDKVAFAQVKLIRPVDPGAGALHRGKAAIAEFAAIPFMAGGGGYVSRNWKVYPSERAAVAAFLAAGGGKGYPAAKLTGIDVATIDALRDAADDLVDALPATKQYAADAFPTNLAFCYAKWKLSGQPAPLEVMDRIAAYKAGYGVAGRTADGSLYIFGAY